MTKATQVKIQNDFTFAPRMVLPIAKTINSPIKVEVIKIPTCCKPKYRYEYE